MQPNRLRFEVSKVGIAIDLLLLVLKYVHSGRMGKRVQCFRLVIHFLFKARLDQTPQIGTVSKGDDGKCMQ
jgi:hypothetical protein